MNKFYSILFFFIIFSLISCKTEDDQISEEVILTENIEVYNANLVDDDYILAIKNGSTEAFIIDKAGNKLHNWVFDSNLGNDLELLPDGKLIGMFKSENPEVAYGGYGGIAKILNPDGTTYWEFEHSTSNYISHHDIEMLSNGNVMFLVWERITAQEAQSQGADTAVDIFPEVLLEVNPNTNEIVWEWHSWDHIIQDNYANLPNYGVLSSNPQRININYNLNTNGDLMHANGIDLDEDRDVIFMSVNKYSEIWVIDHSTTTIEASTNTGGNYNKGGNLLYRFGNPETYNNSFGERRFYSNHFPNFLENNVPGAGNILVYMNGNNIEQSTVYELDIPETFNLQANVDNEPTIVWSFTDEDFYFGKLSGAVRLQNGNTLICEGDYGFWEVTQEGEVVWKYNKLESGASLWRGYNYSKNSDEMNSLGL